MDPQLFLPSSELPKYDWTECTSCDVAAALNGDPDFIEESAGAIVVSNLGRTFAAASNKNNISNNNIGSGALGNQSPPLRPFSSFLSTSISSIADPTSFLVHHVEIPTDVVPVACPPQILETVLQQLRSMRAVPMKQLNLENDEYQIPERENTNVLLRFRTMPPAEDQFINLSPSRMPIVTFAVVYAPTAKAEGAQKALNYLKRRMSEAETKGHLQLLIVSPEYQVVSSSSTMSSNNLGSNSTATLSQQQLPQRQPKPRSSHSSSSSSTFGNNKIRCIIPDMPEPSSTFVHIPWCVSGNTTNNNTRSKSSPFTTTETTPEVTASPLLPAGSTATLSTSSFGQQQQQQPPATAKTPYDTKVILQNFCVTVATAGAAWACGRLRSLSGTSNATFFATALDEPRFSLLQGDNDPSGRIEMRAAKYRADLHLLLGRPIQAYRGLNHRQLFVRSAARGPGDFLWICSASDTLCAIRWLCLKGVLMTAKRDADWIFANRACFADSVAAKPDDYEKARKTLNGIWGRWSNALRIDHTGKSDAFDCYVNWAQQFQWSCTSFDGTLPEFNNNVFNGGSNNNNNINQTSAGSSNNNNVGGVNNNTNNTNSTSNTAAQGNNNTNSNNNNNNGNQPFTEAQREQMKAQRAIIISQQCVPAREFDDFLDNIFHDFEEDLVANIQSLQDVGSRVIFTGSDRIAAVPRLEAEARYLHFLAIRCIVQPTSVRAPRILLSSCRDFVRKYLAYAHSVSKELNEHFSRLNSINNSNNNGAPQDPAQPKIAPASPSYISCLLNGLDKFKTIRFGMAWLLRRAGLHRSAVEFLREALCSIASMIYASYNNNNGGGSSTSSSTAANAIIASPIHDPVLMMELWTELLRWVGVNGSAPLSAGTLLASSSASNLSSGNNFLSSSSFYQCGGKTFIDSILPEIEKASPNRTSPITGDIVRAFVEQAFSGIVFATASISTSSSLSSASTTTGGQQQTQHSRTLSGQSKSFPPNFTAKQLALQMKRQHITAAINTMRIRAATLTLLRINDSFFSDEVCVDFFRRFLASSGSGREMQQSSIFVNYENNNQPSLPSNMNTPQNFGYESSNNAVSSPIAPSSSSSTRNFQQQQQQRQLTTALQSQQQSLMMQTSLNASPNGECGAGLSVIGVESKPLPSHLAPQPVRSHGYMEGAFKDDYYYAKNPITGIISRTGPVIWVVDEVCVLHVEIHNAFVFPLQVDRVALRNNNKSKNASNVGIAFDSTMLTIPAQQTMAVDLFFQPVVIGDAELDGVVWTSSMLCGSSELEFFSPFPTPLVTPVMDELPSATMRIAQDLSIITPYSGNNGTPNRHNNNNNNNGNNNGTQNQVNNAENNNNGNDTSSLEPNLRFQPQLPEITIFQGQKVEIPITVINTGKTAIPLTQEKLDRATKMWYSTMNASAHEQHCQLRVCAGCASVVQILAPNLMGLRTLDAGEEFLTTLVVNPKEGWIVPSQSTLLNSNTNSNALKVTELSTVTAPAAAAGPMITVSNAAAVSKHNHSYSLAVVSPRMAMHKYSQSLLQSGGGMAASLRAGGGGPNSGLLLAAPPPPPFFVPPAIIQPVKSNVRLEVFASKEPPFTIEQSEISKLSAASSVFCHLPARVTRLNLSVNILPSVRALSVSLSASKRILVSMTNDNREWAVEMKREVHVMSDRGEILDTLKITGDVLCGPGQTQPIVVPISSSSRSSTTATSNNNNINIGAADTTPLPRNNNNFPSPNGQIFVSPGNNNNSNNTPVAILKEAYSLVFHWQYLQCYEKFREGKTEVPLASIRHQISDRFSVADLSVSVTVASEELVHHHQNEGDAAHRNNSNNYFENFDDCGAEQGSLPLHSPFLKTIKKWNVKSTDMVVESDETIPVDVLGNYRVQVVITAPKSWLLNCNDANNNNNNPITTFDVDFDIPGGAMIDGCTNGSLEFKNQIISLLSTSVHRNKDNTGNAPASGNNSRQGTNLDFFAVGEAEASQEEEAAAAAPLAKKRKSVNIIEDDNNNNNKIERGANSKIENNNHLSGFSFTGPSMTSSTFEPSQKPLQQDATKVFATHDRKENSSDNNNNNNNNSNNQDPDDGDIEGEGDASIVVLDGVKSPEKNSSPNGRNKKDDDEKVEDDLPSDVENNDDDDDDDDCVVALDQNRIVEHISPLIQDDPPHKILTTPKPSQVASVNAKNNDSKNNNSNNEKSKKGTVDNSHNDSVVTIESEGGNDSVIHLPASIQLVREQQQQRLQNSQQVTNNSSNVTNSSQTVTNNMNNNGKVDQKNNDNNQQPQHPRHDNGSNNSSALPKKLAAKIELDCLLFAVGSMKLRITLKTGNDKKTFMVPLLVQASHY